jgi:hypothetical protein
MDALRSLAAESPADGDGGPEDADAHNKRLALMMFAGPCYNRSLVCSTSARSDGVQGERLIPPPHTRARRKRLSLNLIMFEEWGQG